MQQIVRVDFFNARELAEIPRLLMKGEHMLAAVNGFYTAGTAVLCVTSKRLLLVDKKLLRLSIEDVRFESIKEVNYSQQAILASLCFFYAGREMQFRTWHRRELRILSQVVQEKMFDVRGGATLSSNESPFSPPPQFSSYLMQRKDRWNKANVLMHMTRLSSRAGRLALRQMIT